jgi:hypothetical protein
MYDDFETREEKFRRVGERRANQVMEAMRKLGTLAKSPYYKAPPEDKDKMVGAIDNRWREVRALFEAGRNRPFRF